MTIEQSVNWLAGSVLVMLGFVVVVAGLVVINNILHRYWKPVNFFTADSWNPFNTNARYMTDEEYTRITPNMKDNKDV